MLGCGWKGGVGIAGETIDLVDYCPPMSKLFP
jgi:hypothetical protein